jgi:beta-hydroxylase
VIAASSLASNEPVLDVRDFAWTATLRRDWRGIRDEALALTGADGSMSAVCGTIALWRDGQALDEGCPRTRAALATIPGLHDAAFARLAPSAHVLPRRGSTKALVTCHLGLVVPRDGGARMRVRDRIVRWAEGETLVFDDTYCHEAWNDAQAARVILHLRFARPLRQPGRMIADSILRLLGTQS